MGILSIWIPAVWENPDDTPFNAIRLNLRNGEQTALESLLGIDRSDYPYGYLLDSSTVANLYSQKWGTMMLFRSNSGQGGESLLLNLCRRQRVPHQLAGR